MSGGTVPPEPDPDPDPPGPEPDPDPPEPTTPAYTYDSIGDAFSGGTVYEGIRSNAVLCEVITSFHPEAVNFSDLIKIGSNYYPYAVYSYQKNYLDNNNVRWAWNASDIEWENKGTISITSQTPSDYLTNIRSGNYTLGPYS